MEDHRGQCFYASGFFCCCFSQLTDHLFEPKDGPRKGQDLMALNIQRGRDHAVQPYNEYREFFGLGRITSFRDARLGRNGRTGILNSIYE